MKIKQAIHALQDNYQTIDVKFYSRASHLPFTIAAAIPENWSKSYTYKAPNSISLEQGNIVVVPTSQQVLKLAVVWEIHSVPHIDYDSKIDYLWIFGRVPVDEYFERLEEERKTLEKLKEYEHQQRRKQVVAQLQESIGLSDLETLNLKEK